MTTPVETRARYVVNPALMVIRSSDDELIVRHGSRGRSTQRLTDGDRGGRLGPLVSRFVEPAASDDLSGREQELFAELLETGVVIPAAQAQYAYVAAGVGRPVEPVTTALALVGTGRLADEVGRSLEDLFPDADLSAVASVDALAEDPDVLVAVSDSPDIGYFFDVNEYALTSGVRWHSAFVDGPECVVGPLYRPGMTGCFHDFDVLDEAGRSLRVDHVYSKSNRAIIGAEESPLPRFLAQLVAGYLTMSVAQDLLGEGSYLEGEFLRIDSDRIEVIKQQLTRLARCPACLEQRPDLRHPFI